MKEAERIETRSKKREKKKKEKRNKIFKKFIITMSGLVISLSVIGLGVTFFIYNELKYDISKYIQQGYDKVASIDNTTFNNRIPTQILDKDGNLIKEFKTVVYDYQTYDEINKSVFDAFIAVEDVRFYEHQGIDLKGTLRAIYSTLIKQDVQGGSTITQQLAKNIFLSMDKTIWRKLEEAVIAQELEKKYSKKQILEFYVNNINFANGCYSIESASEYYFNKETEELSLSEIAFLVGIPNNPTLYNPLKNMDNALKRRDKVLNNMYEANMISEAQLESEKAKEIVLNVQKVELDNSLGDNYALNYAVQKATETLMTENGFHFKYSFATEEERDEYFKLYNEMYAECRQELIDGGYKVETSIDMELQNKLQSILDNKLKSFKQINKENDLYMKQGSATVIDNKTGNVVAIVGGRTQDGNTYNRAVLGARQPGSAIKPFVSYLPAFEQGYVPDDVYEDKAIEKGPSNWYSGYKGLLTLRYATEISTNTIPFRLTKEVGTKNAIEYLEKMKFKYLTPNDSLSPIISIGGFERGVTSTEMASAFSTLARNGEFIEPTNIEKITKIGTDELIYSNDHKKVRIYDEGASYLMTDTLKGVLSQEHGTGHNYQLSNYPYQAGKTGTTNNSKDFWFCGYTPYYSMSVWVGDDIPKSQSSGAKKAPGYIWQDMMEYLHQGKEVIDFEKPDSIYTDEKGVLRAKLNNDTYLIKEREEIEEKRKLDEIQEQKDRLLEEEYRIVYGLTEEEENERERLAKEKLQELANYNFYDLSQVGELDNLLDTTKIAIDKVKRKSVSDYLNEQYNSYKSNFEFIQSELERQEQEKLDEFFNNQFNNQNTTDSIIDSESQDNIDNIETDISTDNTINNNINN